MDTGKTLTKMQWGALAALVWLAPLAYITSVNGALAAGKWLPLLVALLLASLFGCGLLWICRTTALTRILRESTTVWTDLARMLLAVYLLVVAGYFLRGAATLWTVWAVAETPIWLYQLMLLSFIGYGLHRGSSAILRLAVLAMAAVPILALLDTLLLLPKFRWDRMLLPTSLDDLLVAGTGNYLAILAAAMPVFLWYGAPQDSSSRKAVGLGWVGSGIYLLLLPVRDTLTQGILTTWEYFPLLRTLKMVEMGVGLNRVEYLAILVLMSAMFTGVLVLAAASREMLKRSRPWQQRGSIILSILVLAAATFL